MKFKGSQIGIAAVLLIAVLFLVIPGRLADLFTSSSKKGSAESVATFEGQPIGAFETIHLQPGEDRTIEFKSGYSLKISGPAEFFVEKWSRDNPDSPLLLHLLSGEFEVLQSGNSGQLYVLKDRQMMSPEKRSEGPTKTLVIEQKMDVDASGTPESADTTPEPEDTPATASKASGPASTLSNDFINDKISSERNQFIRCQSNSMRDGKTSAGNILIAFVITPRGQTDQVRVLQSTLKNPEFESCVTSVFQRITFRSFTGSAITRSFPLTFE